MAKKKTCAATGCKKHFYGDARHTYCGASCRVKMWRKTKRLEKLNQEKAKTAGLEAQA